MKHLTVDIGNVVCEVNFTSFLRKLSKTLNIPLQETEYFLNRTQKLHDLGLTVIQDEIHDHFKIKSPVIIEELVEDWNKTVYPNTTVIAFLHSLIKPSLSIEPIKLAILSNMGSEHSELMVKMLSPIYDDAIKFFSCDVGARKPTYLYYKTFLDLYPEFKGCLYIDDRPENLKTGELFGFRPYKLELDKIKNNAELMEKLGDIKNLI